MEFINRTHNNTEDRNEWRTPLELFEALDSRYSFTLDACANKENALCSKFYTKDNSALNHSWKNESVFINPPFKMAKEFTNKFTEEAGAKSPLYMVMLLNANTDTNWFLELTKAATKIVLISGRITFLNNKGEKKGQPTKGQMLAIYSKEIERRSQAYGIDIPTYEAVKKEEIYNKTAKLYLA